jgi:hypothetical protein
LNPSSLELGKRASPPINVLIGSALIYTTFSNVEPFRQNYACGNVEYVSSTCYFGDEKATFGAAALNSLGYNTFPTMAVKDAVYKIKLTFTHDKSDLILTFFGNLKEVLAPNRNTGNEGWGLDNVRVEVQ